MGRMFGSMTSRSVVMIVAAMGLAHPTPAGGQGNEIRPETSVLLRSDDWMERARGVRTVEALIAPGLSDAAREQLVATLERELQVVEDSYRRGVGVSNELGEGYGEYLATLQDMVLNVADYADERQVRVLALGVYNPDSPLVSQLARRAGVRLLPVATAMVGSDLSYTRWNGLAILGELYGSREALNLSTAAVDEIRATLYAAARNDDQVMRQWAVRSIGGGRSRQDAAILQEIASSDPASRTHEARGVIYPVREAAEEALRAIEEAGLP